MKMSLSYVTKGEPVVIVLAAGSGERYRQAGGGTDKLDALLGDVPVREHVMSSVRASGLPWHVVERSHTAHSAHPGMGTSIACGVAATAEACGWLILPADLPLIQPATLRALANAMQQHAVVVPRYRRQRGHPVGFGYECREALLALSGDIGAKKLIEQFEHIELKVADLGCVLDVDTPHALDWAQKFLDFGHRDMPPDISALLPAVAPNAKQS